VNALEHPSHSPWDELVVGHALSALEPDDEQALTAHLASCARCERALDEHVETLGHLAYAAGPAEPPPALLEGIRSAVRDAGAPAAFESPGSPAPVDELARARDRRRLKRGAAWTSAAAAVALVVSLGAWNLTLRHDNAEQGRLSDRLASAVEAVETSPGRTVPLEDSAGEVTAVAVLHQDQLSLVVDGLTPNDRRDSTYVLWGQALGGSAQALATFDVRDGKVDVLRDVALPAALRPDLRLIMVTREAGRTAPAATVQPILATGQVT